MDDSRFPNPESSAVTAFLHSRNDSVISNRSRSPADQPSEEFALRRRRVCVIAGLRVSGMPASTGRREQSVCFLAGKRGPASECRVSRAGAGRGAARQTGRGAALTLRLAAPIRCLCCATVSVPVEMPWTVVRVRRAAITEVWGCKRNAALRHPKVWVSTAI